MNLNIFVILFAICLFVFIAEGEIDAATAMVLENSVRRASYRAAVDHLFQTSLYLAAQEGQLLSVFKLLDQLSEGDERRRAINQVLIEQRKLRYKTKHS